MMRKWYVSFKGHGENGSLIIIQVICCSISWCFREHSGLPSWPPNFSAESHRCAGETGPLCWHEPIQPELPSLHSLWAATVCYCGTTKCQCCHELQIWMNIESAWLISWLLKQNKDRMICIQSWKNPCIYILIRMVWSISQHIWSCCADQHVLIVILKYMYIFEFLAKRWCQRVKIPPITMVILAMTYFCFNHINHIY